MFNYSEISARQDCLTPSTFTIGSTRDLIAEYYSLADVNHVRRQLCPRTFGNTPFESLGCGTPAILSRVSTYRDLFSDEHGRSH